MPSNNPPISVAAASPVPADLAPPASARQWLRQRLLAQRTAFLATLGAAAAEAALAAHLVAVLAQLVPDRLGVYMPREGEFNAARPWAGEEPGAALPLALPFAQRTPRALHYRVWDGQPPTLQDDWGIPTVAGAPVVPDVLLVPCVGHTDDGFRLGYGGGYFDRYLAAHPDITAVGVTWSVGRMAPGEFVPEAHDRALMLIVTEAGVLG